MRRCKIQTTRETSAPMSERIVLYLVTRGLTTKPTYTMISTGPIKVGIINGVRVSALQYFCHGVEQR